MQLCTEAPKNHTLEQLALYGYWVEHLQSDRGSEYLSQEGNLMADRDRSLGQLDAFCASQSPIIRHTATPVGSKEKIAEVRFRDMFETADALLFEAQLSPAFCPSPPMGGNGASN